MLTKIQKGQIFGELALITSSQRSATAVARTDCEILYINQDKLKAKLDDADPFLQFWIQYLSDRVLDLSKRGEELATPYPGGFASGKHRKHWI